MFRSEILIISINQLINIFGLGLVDVNVRLFFYNLLRNDSFTFIQVQIQFSPLNSRYSWIGLIRWCFIKAVFSYKIKKVKFFTLKECFFFFQGIAGLTSLPEPEPYFIAFIPAGFLVLGLTAAQRWYATERAAERELRQRSTIGKKNNKTLFVLIINGAIFSPRNCRYSAKSWPAGKADFAIRSWL